MSDDERKPLSSAELATLYAEQMELVRELITDVRLHRLEECDGSPLCPGPQAGRKVNATPQHMWGNLLLAMMSFAADRTGEVESLRVEIGELRTQCDRAQAGWDEAERDREAGWAAYRSVVPARAEESHDADAKG